MSARVQAQALHSELHIMYTYWFVGLYLSGI